MSRPNFTTPTTTLTTLTTLPQPQKIVLLGFGDENRQFLTWLIQVVKFSPSQIIISDRKPPNGQNLEILKSLEISLANQIFGENYLEVLSSSDVELVFKSPGIWSLKPELESFRAKKGQDSVLSPLVFFMQKFREQIVGVTGTKGKTTTSSLIEHFLKGKLDEFFDPKSNQKRNEPTQLQSQTSTQKNLVHYCGNTTGVSPYKYWLELDQTVNTNQFFIVELSSFQLQDLGYSQVSPKFGVISNYFVDHLDQHANKFEYWKSKSQLFNHQKNGEYLISTEQFLKQISNLESKIETEVGKDKVEKYTFNQPKNQEFIIIDETLIWLKNFYRTNLIGEHNWQNTVTALIVSEIILQIISNQKNANITFYQVLKDLIRTNRSQNQSLINTFSPVKRRLELLHTLKIDKYKINFYNDSAATEPDAVEAAIQALTQNPQDLLWLVVAGKDKGGDLLKLAELILQKIESQNIYKLSLCGEVGQNLYNLLISKKPDLQAYTGSFISFVNSEIIIDKIKQDWEKFTIQIKLQNSENINLNIVFSACGSSFDEFKTVDQRSNFWNEAVSKLS